MFYDGGRLRLFFFTHPLKCLTHKFLLLVRPGSQIGNKPKANRSRIEIFSRFFFFFFFSQIQFYANFKLLSINNVLISKFLRFKPEPIAKKFYSATMPALGSRIGANTFSFYILDRCLRCASSTDNDKKKVFTIMLFSWIH